ncbi:hypothetical protein [Bradyrhizobium icense]|uniref:hypothetical protein n=1 Tax=Bradyrhizobium icense TaxID=1274631 RepID=UPI001F3BBA67|nr:hypothetical protein [Bradyrhizobium icense]
MRDRIGRNAWCAVAIGASIVKMSGAECREIVAVGLRSLDAKRMGLYGIAHSECKDGVGQREVATTCCNAVKAGPCEEKAAERDCDQAIENETDGSYQAWA